MSLFGEMDATERKLEVGLGLGDDGSKLFGTQES